MTQAGRSLAARTGAGPARSTPRGRSGALRAVQLGIDGPAVLGLGGGQVLIRGPVVALVARLVRTETARASASRRDGGDGITEPENLVAVRRVLDAEARAVAGWPGSDGRETTGRAGSRWVDVQAGGTARTVGTAEAAAVLGLSDRETRRRAARGDFGAFRSGWGWRYDAAAVVAVANERTSGR